MRNKLYTGKAWVSLGGETDDVALLGYDAVSTCR